MPPATSHELFNIIALTIYSFANANLAAPFRAVAVAQTSPKKQDPNGIVFHIFLSRTINCLCRRFFFILLSVHWLSNSLHLVASPNISPLHHDCTTADGVGDSKPLSGELDRSVGSLSQCVHSDDSRPHRKFYHPPNMRRTFSSNQCSHRTHPTPITVV